MTAHQCCSYDGWALALSAPMVTVRPSELPPEFLHNMGCVCLKWFLLQFSGYFCFLLVVSFTKKKPQMGGQGKKRVPSSYDGWALLASQLADCVFSAPMLTTTYRRINLCMSWKLLFISTTYED
jgi:hypothetical protein